MRNKTLVFVFLFFILLTIYSLHIPFFWDGTFVSTFACQLYNGSYTLLNFPPIQDNNTVFPLFSIYLFTVWKVFSKSLLISHLALFPFLLGICYEFFKLSKKFLQEKFISFALLLLMFEPTFVTQSILMSYDIILLYLFLLLLNLLLEERYKLFTFIIPVLALYSVRGMFLALSLALIQFILIYPKNSYKSFLIVLKNNSFSLLIMCGFAFFKIQTEGSIFSSIPETCMELNSLSMMLRQTLFIGWKIIDFGQVILWLSFIIGLIYIYKKKGDFKDIKVLLLVVFVPTLITTAFMVPFTNPIAHRYFMFTYLLLIIGVCYVLQQINNKKAVYLLLFLFSAALISGNCWLYPERYGNGWDASLKVLPYFHLKEQMDNYIQQNNIAANEVGTQFPLIADKRFSHLSDSSYQYTNVWAGPIENHHYFLQSNIINTDIPEQIEAVKKNWNLLKEFRAGQIYIRLYKNNITPSILQ